MLYIAIGSEQNGPSVTRATRGNRTMAGVFQRLHPRAYLERFLAENLRPDKRLCDGFRDVHVNVGELFPGGGGEKHSSLLTLF
jgi:exosome complex component RRP43